MKQRFFKIFIPASAIAAITLFMAYGNSSAKTIDKDLSNKAHMGDVHPEDHIYACPMHPEVSGKEGDTCPKCGMKLEHNDNAGTAANVFMAFSTNPTKINPGQEVTLFLTPTIKDKPNEKVPLDVEHTKKIHLIAVSEDLSWFDHIHPEFNADGSYSVKEKFPMPGTYTLFADYKPSGDHHIVDKLNVTVEGKIPAPETYNTNKLTAGASDGFSVSLSPEGGSFLTRTSMHIKGTVMQNGKELDVNTLENYLGAKAHMVVISLAGKDYLHVHPEAEDGKFDLHTTFDKPGLYRAWIQFQNKGKVYTAAFVINVAEGLKTAEKPSETKHAHH